MINADGTPNHDGLRTAPLPEWFWEKHYSDYAQRNLSKHGGGDPSKTPWCTLCGRLLDPAKAWTVHVIGGGGTLLHNEDEDKYTDDGGDMGCWDLGPECAKQIPVAFRSPYASESHLRAR